MIDELAYNYHLHSSSGEGREKQGEGRGGRCQHVKGSFSSLSRRPRWNPPCTAARDLQNSIANPFLFNWWPHFT